MQEQPTWPQRAKGIALALLSVAFVIALTQALVACPAGDDPPPPSGGGGLIWDQGNWDQKDWQ